MRLKRQTEWPKHLDDPDLSEAVVAAAKANHQLDLLCAVTVASNKVDHIMEKYLELQNIVVDHDEDLAEWRREKDTKTKLMEYARLLFGAGGWAVTFYLLFLKK